MTGKWQKAGWKALVAIVAFTGAANLAPAQSTNVIVLPAGGLPEGLVLPPGVQLPPGVVLPAGVELPSGGRQSTNALSKTNAPASPEEKRLQELLKLQFDRRAPAVLDALAKQAAGNGELTNEVQRFQADTVAGDWKAVKKFLATLPEKH